VRRVLAVVVLAVAFLIVGAAAPLVTTPNAAGFQEEPTTTQEGEQPLSTVERILSLGEAYSGNGYTLTPTAAFWESSPDRAGYSEVRLNVNLVNQTLAAIPLSDYGLPEVEGEIEFFLQDARANRYSINLPQPLRASRPGSEITALERGLSSRWTLGYQLPESLVETSRLVLVVSGTRVAEWDITTGPVGVEWAAPPFSTVQIGSQFPWDTSQRATATSTGTLVCGDPSIEPVAHIFTVAFQIENNAASDYPWPGMQYPAVPVIAQWADGSSARMSLETHVGDPDPYFHVFGAAGVVIPALQTAERAFVMAAPRDGRFVDISRLPSGLWMLPPAGGPIWLDLEGTAPSIGIDPALCDLGEFPAPLPYAFAPSPKFIGSDDLDREEAQDEFAHSLLRSAVSASGLYYDANGLTFRNVTTADLEQYGPNIDWVATNAGTALSSGVGRVYWDTFADRRNDFYVITQSASGSWICNHMRAYDRTVSFTAATSTDAAELCLPELAGEDTDE